LAFFGFNVPNQVLFPLFLFSASILFDLFFLIGIFRPVTQHLFSPSTPFAESSLHILFALSPTGLLSAQLSPADSHDNLAQKASSSRVLRI
jgi:hypothetical protein